MAENEERRSRGNMAADDASIEVRDAGGSRSPNGQHIFSTQVGEVIEEGSMLRHAGGAWQAAGWHLRVRGLLSGAAITNGKVR
jgi:hypothetical protein